MRRSSAPSALNSRSKFTPPTAKRPRIDDTLRAPLTTDSSSNRPADMKVPSLLELMRDPSKIQKTFHTKSSSTLSVSSVGERRTEAVTVSLAPSSSSEIASSGTPASKRFAASTSSASSTTASSITSGDVDSDDKWVDSLFFHCVYAKHSTRKHKKWEGDGVVVIKGKSVVLKVRIVLKRRCFLRCF